MEARVSDTERSARNPVERILAGSRRVGGEYCWPIGDAIEVAEALGAVGQAILGFELWSFDEELTPRVVTWSEYRLSLNGPWREVVTASVRAAAEGLRVQVGTLWANLTWVSEREAQSLTSQEER